MRRSAAIVMSIVGALALAVGAVSPAVAGTKAPAHLVGHLDSLTYVSEFAGVVATGWVIDLNNPHSTDSMLRITKEAPEQPEHVVYQTPSSLPRPDVGKAYPAAGPNHGFSNDFGPTIAGTYRICVAVTAQGTKTLGNTDAAGYISLGCLSYTLPHAKLGGRVESLTTPTDPTGYGMVATGWISDNLHRSDDQVVGALSQRQDDGSYRKLAVIGGGDADLARPDIVASHPGLVGVKGFTMLSLITRAGTYRVCASVISSADPPPAPVDLGCTTATFAGMTRTIASSLSGTPILGATLAADPGTWSPAPSGVAYIWRRTTTTVSTFGSPVPRSVMHSTYPLGPGDVGHQIGVEAVVKARGTLGGDTWMPPAGIVRIPGVATTRVQAPDRFTESVAVSQRAFPDSTHGAPVVYVASGTAFPDALSAGPAAAHQGGSLLLTNAQSVPGSVTAEIRRLHPSKIVVVGGPASVSNAVAAKLASMAPTVRLSGADRYAVSRAVDRYAFPAGAAAAFVVTGLNYPDALSASGAAASVGAPVVMVKGTASRTDAATLGLLRSLHVGAITIAGGTASVSSGIAGSLGSGITVARAAGADRYAVSSAVNGLTFTTANTVYLATGLNFPDGLSGGALAGRAHGPLFLTNGTCVPQAVISSIAKLHAANVVILGGTGSMNAMLDDLYACDR
ncbi:cell wall-binding repeat-containing protein [Leifsonia poae]|uniref:Cell wall-binding repeat-containing protein n=1 Tax=Leifsonia poae TaxID=110933 RepID=A0A9W6HB16_9MICO|nr:cell wall-binding repeat-containing protein [Leifsonia poae]GLJ77239.1 hypothetical protein GCM10017584_28130 [Leifsonia poae]